MFQDTFWPTSVHVTQMSHDAFKHLPPLVAVTIVLECVKVRTQFIICERTYSIMHDVCMRTSFILVSACRRLYSLDAAVLMLLIACRAGAQRKEWAWLWD
jgi:hypothetical protein